MPHHVRFFTGRVLCFGMVAVLFLSAGTCRKGQDIDITARTTVSGGVNGGALEATVVASINTGRGGTSTCTYTKLPSGFNPAVLGTHG